MSLSDWQAQTGAYMPSWEARIAIAIANMRPDYAGRFPAWYLAYCIGRARG